MSPFNDVMNYNDATTRNSVLNQSLASVLSGLPSYDPNALSVVDAQYIIQQFTTPLCNAEKVVLSSALDRVLANDIVSPINVPGHCNSAMDGYALRGVDLASSKVTKLKVIGIALAGRPFTSMVAIGQAVRITTGAIMPEGCDTVVPQEHLLDASETSITIPPDVVRPSENCRLIGEDLRLGSTALLAGKILRPADLGLLASLGFGEVSVRRRLRVAFFSTGDELRSPGETLEPGCIYDSNRYTLYGMLKRLGCDVIDIGVIKDNPTSLRASFNDACEGADAVITSGGASAGVTDYTREVTRQMGDVAFWNITMRPGRPMTFGRICVNDKRAYLFGLPGNPVATMVSFYFFVRAALLRLMGAQPTPLFKFRVTATCKIKKRVGRTEYQRGILSSDSNGRQQVEVTGNQGSGLLHSMAGANCIILLEQERGNVAAGELVDVVLLESLG